MILSLKTIEWFLFSSLLSLFLSNDRWTTQSEVEWVSTALARSLYIDRKSRETPSNLTFIASFCNSVLNFETLNMMKGV